MGEAQNHNTIDEMVGCIRSEVMRALGRSRPGEKITIFLSDSLCARLRGALVRDLQFHNDSEGDENITLFGCKVETYMNRKPSFYVAMAKRIEF